MKIARITHAFYPQKIGGSIFYVKSISDYQKNDYKINIFTFNFDDKQELVNFGYNVYYLYGVNIRLPFNIIEWPIPFKLIEKLNEFKPDLIDIHGHLFYLSFQATKYAYKHSIPSILTVHGFITPRNWITTFLQKVYIYTICKKIFSMATKIICLNKEIKYNILKLCSNKNKVILLPPPVNVKYFKPIKNIKKIYDIIWVGRMTRSKNLFLLLNALKNTNFKAILVGYGPEFPKIYKFVKKYNLKVDFTGFVPRKKVVHYLRKSKIFVYTSISEGAPLAIIEAMATGLPIIATSIPAHINLVDKDIGFLIPFNSSILRQKIKYVIENVDVFRRMSINARKRAMNYSIENLVKKLNKIYDDIMYHV